MKILQIHQEKNAIRIKTHMAPHRLNELGKSGKTSLLGSEEHEEMKRSLNGRGGIIGTAGP